MPISLRDNSSLWQISFKHQGARYRRSSGTDSRKEAQALERKWRSEVCEGGTVRRLVRLNLREAADRYLATVITPKGRPRAAKQEAYLLENMVKMIGGSTAIEQFSAPKVVAFRDELISGGRAPATINRYLAMLKAILRRAHYEWGALAEVPRIKLFPLNNERTRVLSDDEEQRLLAECVPHLRDLVVFLLDTGCRLSEATQLKWTEVDLDSMPHARVSFLETKSGRPRTVPLPERARTLLVHAKSQMPEGEPRVFLYRPQGRGGRGPGVRCTGKAKPFRGAHGAWVTACARAGIDGLHMHDLRHTYASRLVMRGVPLLTVSKLLGHASIRMTARYSHLEPGAFDAAIAVLNTPMLEPDTSRALSG